MRCGAAQSGRNGSVWPVRSGPAIVSIFLPIGARAVARSAVAQTQHCATALDALKQMSLEQLGNLEVVCVNKTVEHLNAGFKLMRARRSDCISSPATEVVEVGREFLRDAPLRF